MYGVIALRAGRLFSVFPHFNPHTALRLCGVIALRAGRLSETLKVYVLDFVDAQGFVALAAGTATGFALLGPLCELAVQHRDKDQGYQSGE